MSRYSRNFDNKDVSPASLRFAPAYTRYRDKPETTDKLACQLCDGVGHYAGGDGVINCDICAGTGILRREAQHDIPMFRSRSKLAE